jgi:hypothetical protein
MRGERCKATVTKLKIEKLTAVAAVSSILIWGALIEVKEFIENDPIGYFFSRPSRLLLVAAIAIGGGLIAYAFSRLPSRAKYLVEFSGWTLAASAMTIFCACFGFEATGLFGFISNGPAAPNLRSMQWNLFSALCFFCVSAGFLWFQVYRIWKKKCGSGPV